MRALTILITLSVALSSASAAFVGLPEDVASKLPAIKQHPLASSILLWANESYELKDDGKVIYEWHSYRYLPDEAARDTWGDPHVAFIEGREQLEIIASRAYTPDGRIVESTPWNSYNPITPEALEHAPALTHFRQMVVTHLGLENGCIVEFHYRLTKNDPLLPWFEGRVELREESPTIYRALQVRVPSGTTLLSENRNGAPKAQAEGSSLAWVVQNVSGYHPADLAGHRELLPLVVFTTAADWQAIQSEFSKRVATAQTFSLAVPKSLEESLWKAPDPRSKLDSLQSWISERFSVSHFSHPEFDLSLRGAAEILNAGYGNALELAAMSSQLLTQSGIDNVVVLQSTGHASIPLLADLKNVVLSLRIGGEELLCDPMKPGVELSTSDLAECSLSYLDNKPEHASQYRTVDGGAFHLSIVLNNLDDDTLSGHGSLYASGPVALGNDLRADGPVSVIEGLIDWEGFACTEATVQELARDKAAVVFDFTAPALEEIDDYRALPLSLMDFGMLATGAPLKLPDRQFAQCLSGPASLKLEIRGTVPDDWEIAKQPSEVSQTSALEPDPITGFEGKMSVSAQTKTEAKRYEYTRSLVVGTDWIPAANWPVFRQAVLSTLAQPGNEILFLAPDSDEGDEE